MAMASNRPKDFIDYLMTGRGDPNRANAPYDPILQNINTPRPSDAPAIEIPVPIKSKPAAPYSRQSTPAPSKVQSRGVLESKSKTVSPPALDYSSFDRSLKAATDQSLDASKKMEKGVKEFKNAPRKEFYEPDYQEQIRPFKEAIPKYEEEVGIAGDAIRNYIDKTNQDLRDAQLKEDAVRATYQSNVSNIEKDLEELTNNPPKLQSIDQGNFWEQKSTGNKIMLGISLALSALTPEGIKNATGIVSDAINRDIDAQKQNNIYKKEKYQSLIATKQNSLNYFLNKYNNETAAINSKRSADMSATIGLVNMITQGLNNKQTLLNAQKFISELQTNAERYRTEARNELIKIEDQRLNNELIAVTKGVEVANEAAKMQLESAKAKEEQLYHKGQLGIASKELQLKLKEKVPAIFDDAYANAIEFAIPSGDPKNAKAHEQLGILRDQFAKKKMVRDYLLKAMDIGPVKFGTGYFADREFLKDATLVMFPVIKGIMGERFTDNDFKQLVDPFLPSRFTPREQLVQRLKSIEQALDSNIKETPIVDNLGFRRSMQRDFENAYKNDAIIRGK